MITSNSNSRLKQVAALLQKSKERREKKLFVIEGTKMFEEAPERLIKEVYVSASYLTKNGVSAKLKTVGYEEVADDVFQKLSDTKTPQGILAVVQQMSYTLEDILGKKSPLIIMLEDIQDPGNLGTIMRTAEGAGVTGVIMSRETVDLYNPKTIRSTMGSIFRVPFIYVESLTDYIEKLSAKQVKTYAAHLKGKVFYDELDYNGGTAFLIGNEGNGLKDATACAATEYMKIPMEGKLESLNAGVATALLIYEASRQRRHEAISDRES